ncbi:UDP-N-acetylmuramoyl-L-alanine--D-glutamate ligase [bacterium]|nr:UDP-N-acetylmuramoyl-L-alanine--D-glutamate ligase [bacterium]
MTIEERIRERRIGVIGMARSGLAAARLALRFGGKPFVTDSAREEILVEPIAALRKVGIEYEAGGHTDRVLDSDYVIISPGVPPTVPIVAKLRERGIPIFSELEFASWVCKAPIVAVTGSNGKTTTTTLIGEIFAAAGWQVEVCGNIGRPFAEIADRVGENGVAVVETSSFQLETIADFQPRVALLLNVQPDHLDRHRTLEAYRAVKYRICENQQAPDCFIVNHDDPQIDLESIPTSATKQSFSIVAPNGAVTYIRNNTLGLRRNGSDEDVIAIDDIRIKGRHNLQNASAAVAATAALGVPVEAMAEALRSFAGVEHRLEPVETVAGIKFVNDSKATNVDSVVVALQSMTTPVYLIAGGRDKGAPYTPIVEVGRSKIKGILAIGEARDKIFNDLGQAFPTQFAATLEEAVMKAFELALPGETVLLSPGCASFDMFENFEHRGRAFKAAVAALRNGKKKNETLQG